MKLTKHVNPNNQIIIIFLLLTVPSVEMLFFTNIIPGFILIFLYPLLIVSIIWAYIIYLLAERRKYFRFGMTLIIPLIIAISIYTFRDQQNFGDIIYFKKNEIELNDFVKEIKKHPQIRGFYRGDNYEQVHDKYGIDEKTYDDFKKRLNALNCILYDANRLDGSIAFVTDGFIAHQNGIMYHEGADTVYGALLWKKVADNWYIWGD